MRLNKNIASFIIACLIAPLSLPQPFAQAENPFNTEAEEWPDIAPEATIEQKKSSTDKKLTSETNTQPVLKSETKSQDIIATTPEVSKQQITPPETKEVQPSSSSSSISSSSRSSSNYQTSSKNSSKLKRSGPSRILICRPVYAPYTEETKTMYISSITEAYFHFKFNGIPGYQVIPQDRIANNLQYFRDFSRRLSRTAYIDAAQQLGASYLFYVEYEPQGKKVKFNVEFYSIAENKKLLSRTQELDLEHFEDGLFDCLNEVTSSLSGSISNDVQQFLGSPILGKNTKAAETFGNLISSMGSYSKKRAETVVSDYEKVVKQNADFHLGKMVTASTFALAQMNEKAIKMQESLITSFGSTYPALYLQLASYHRIAGNYSDALNAAERVQSTTGLELPARIEKARIYEAKDDLHNAKNEYEQVLSIGGEDGEIYFQLALVSIGLKDLSSSSNYLSKAESAGRKIDRGDYYDLGLRYKKIGTADEKAIESFKKSLGIQQDNEDAWIQLSEIYSKMGREDDAAECYMSLFHINNNTYKEYLSKAGFKFESLGKMDRAREAYSLFLARRFSDPEVSLRLAKIELQSGNCAKATDLVRGMDTSMIYGAEVKKINQQCGVPERRIVVNTDIKRQRGNAAVFMWRVMSGIITAGGVGVGYFWNTKVDERIAKYTESENTWKSSMSTEKNSKVVDAERKKVDELHSDIEKFKLYRSVSYGAAGAGAGSLALSITLPIVFKK